MLCAKVGNSKIYIEEYVGPFIIQAHLLSSYITMVSDLMAYYE